MEIEIRGLKELRQRLAYLETLQLLRDPMLRSLYRLEERMKTYPPQRPTTYIRKGRLGRAWDIVGPVMTSEGLQGTIGNNTSYGPWVQSGMFQARIHRGYWLTDQQVLEEERDWIIKQFENAIANSI